MTNYELIRIMDKDELAEFLSRIVGHPDRVDVILIWLNAESDDDTVVEHSEGQTINVSHANVVIFD